MELLERGPAGERNIFDEITPEWAWKGSTGAGVKVAVVDSGVDSTHPEIMGCVKGGIEVVITDKGVIEYKPGPHEDAFGHGTACAGIIRSIAPDVEIHSVKVLGSRLTGTGNVMLSGIKWAVDNGMDILNLSLGTTKDAFYATLNKVTEEAYFKKCFLIAALSNTSSTSYPAIFSSLLGVKAITEENPFNFYLNPEPPVELLARGIMVRIPWLQHGYFTTSGNSFAAPVITGIATLIKSKHPRLTPIQMKVVMHSLAKSWGDYGKIKAPAITLDQMSACTHLSKELLLKTVEDKLLFPVSNDGSGNMLFDEKDIIRANRIAMLLGQDFSHDEILKKVRA